MQSEADPNQYNRRDKGYTIYILLYFDDMQIFYPRTAATAAADVKAKLMKQYKITNLGPARQFLGIDIQRHEDGSISLGQLAFIQTILKRFSMDKAHPVQTPLDTHVKLDEIALEETASLLDNKGTKLYQAIVGSLMYAALATRPDIAFTVAALCRYNSQPRTGHMTAAKRVLRYLKGTAELRLHFQSDTNGNLNDIPVSRICGYTDSDWANDSGDRKSQGGYTFGLGDRGLISWQSRKQDLVASSTLEAEYIACSEASREARWLIQLQKDVNGTTSVEAPFIRCDNQGALAIISTGIVKQRTKHIGVCYHNSRDLHARGIVEYTYISTDENVADLFTKPLAIPKHQRFTAAAGLRRF